MTKHTLMTVQFIALSLICIIGPLSWKNSDSLASGTFCWHSAERSRLSYHRRPLYPWYHTCQTNITFPSRRSRLLTVDPPMDQLGLCARSSRGGDWCRRMLTTTQSIESTSFFRSFFPFFFDGISPLFHNLRQFVLFRRCKIARPRPAQI